MSLRVAVGGEFVELAQTEGLPDDELERRVLSLGSELVLRRLAQHWSLVLRDRPEALPSGQTARWRLTFPSGFYAVDVAATGAITSCPGFPGLGGAHPAVVYQWYVLGLLRVFASEFGMDHAFARRWVAVSGTSAVWRAWRTATDTEEALEVTMHRWRGV